MRQAKFWGVVMAVSLIAGCSGQAETPSGQAEESTAESGLDENGDEMGDEASAEHDVDETQVAAAPAVAQPLDVDVDCSTELASAQAALKQADLEVTALRDVESGFPFERQVRNGCGVFPADFLEESAGRSEETSQCNRAILARSLIECVNWSLPSLPAAMAADGFELKVVESETYAAFRQAAAGKDWLRYLSLVQEARNDVEDETAPLTELPEYDTIVWLVTEKAPKFTLLMTGDLKKYPELLGETYPAYRPCDGETLEPCEGADETASVSADFLTLAIGRECASNDIGARSDNQGWVSREYEFDFCSYSHIPVLDGPFQSEEVVAAYDFEKIITDERSGLMEKLSYRETSLGEIRTTLLAAYDRFTGKVAEFAVQDQARFFEDLAKVRKFKAVSDTTPPPPECQGESVDAGECSQYISGPRYLPYTSK